MAERLKAHAWKACVGETLPWVRIPLSPPTSPWRGWLVRVRFWRSRPRASRRTPAQPESHPLPLATLAGSSALLALARLPAHVRAARIPSLAAGEGGWVECASGARGPAPPGARPRSPIPPLAAGEGGWVECASALAAPRLPAHARAARIPPLAAGDVGWVECAWRSRPRASRRTPAQPESHPLPLARVAGSSALAQHRPGRHPSRLRQAATQAHEAAGLAPRPALARQVKHRPVQSHPLSL